VGLIPAARDPNVLALSVLADVVGAYEALHPHR
jgi:xanthine dehydrogenase accessory factor